MASNNWNQNDNRFNFRPQSGNNRNTSFSRESNGDRRSYNYSSADNYNYSGGWLGQYSRNSNYDEYDYVGNRSSSSQPKANDDETSMYAINLQLKPVEMGIVGKYKSWQQEFKGLGAFNHYFGLLYPFKGVGYTLPDIWDGYFHITLARFYSSLAPHQLDEIFSKFSPSIEDLPYIPDVVFRASSISTSSGANRAIGRKAINFVVLPIDLSPEIESFYDKIQPLLKSIIEQAKAIKPNVTKKDELHLTIRKYSNVSFKLENINIQQFPLEFRCSHLEVKQTREQAVDRSTNAKNSTYRWWTGATENKGKCSSCSTPIKSGRWEGFCLACGKYESIIPFWSTDGKNINHLLYDGIKQQECVNESKTMNMMKKSGYEEGQGLGNHNQGRSTPVETILHDDHLGLNHHFRILSVEPDSGIKLPPGWTKEWSKKEERHYYFNINTRESRWEPPN
ncbi:unnamed protein product [Adineta steineri]|uniref:WW domain-containing protein n=1 Tax=Adineta steineri TaxID=433720 RepID=A0A816G9G6_9BILA|nr:unnamed protein product [Adineta steineri]CAF1671395.1 unnamed protein product [Adineta steineri]